MSTSPPQNRLAISELGFGAASLGNLYQPVTDEDARATLDAALDVGITYFDTAPYYGFGLSERRVGDALRSRGGIAVSTKVGRLLSADVAVVDDRERFGFRSPLPFRPVFDYSHDSILRSHEDSLHRLGLSRVNLLYIHDIGSLTHGDEGQRHFEALTKGGGLRALQRLKNEGAIDGFGVGVNEVQACFDIMKEAPLDAVLLAGRYTLLEQDPLRDLLPLCILTGTSVIIGGPYNSGILATGTRGGGEVHFDYAPASADVIARVASIEAVCDRHRVPLAAAALQFPGGHDAVLSVIPGLGSPARIRATVALFQHPIPNDFWEELKHERLIAEDAPTRSSL